MNITKRRTEIILRHLQEKHYAEYCSQYGEPGYQDPEKGVVFCNWNNVPKWVGEYLEEAGYECEWSDEWIIDYDYNKAYRTSADSYHWQPQIMFADGYVLTPDDSLEDWVQECSIQSPNDLMRALPGWVNHSDLKELGFKKYNGLFETGWHPGQTDDPKKTAMEIFKDDKVYEVVFRIAENSQFYIVWEAWYREDD